MSIRLYNSFTISHMWYCNEETSDIITIRAVAYNEW